MAETVEVDYLIVGAGAMGMAFADTMVSDSKKTMAIVDRYARPGGHWTIAYPHVRLHQPSAGYGVNSRGFEAEYQIDPHGWNQGLLELASGSEVCAYYISIMHQTLIPSGRVKWFPKHEYTGDGTFKSIITGKTFRAGANTKIVDATYMNTEVPSMRPPPYQVSSDVEVITPNKLGDLQRPYNHYTVVGAGKTALDAALWLLGSDVPASKLTMIIPRDAYFLDRERFQPGEHHKEASTAHFAEDNESIKNASDVDDLFARLEMTGGLMRLSADVKPAFYRCATITKKEFAAIKEIGTFIRQGRVRSITSETVQCENGSYTPEADTLYIDCSANSVPKRAPVPIFQGKQMTLQPVRFCQQVFSAAFLAHIEATYTDDEQFKNMMSSPIPHPETPTDWMRLHLQTDRNELLWAQQPKTFAWLAQARLNWFKDILPAPPAGASEEEVGQFMQGMGMEIMGLISKLESLMKTLPAGDDALKDVQLEAKL